MEKVQVYNLVAQDVETINLIKQTEAKLIQQETLKFKDFPGFSESKLLIGSSRLQCLRSTLVVSLKADW